MIIINSVERVFFTRLERQLAWNSWLARAILARNEALAERCEGEQPGQVAAGVKIGPHNLAPEARGGWSVIGPGPQLPLLVPATEPRALPCLDLTIATDHPDSLEVFLPLKGGDPSSPVFEAGRSIRIALAKGTQDIRLVLPAYVAGRYVRVDPVVANTTARVLAARVGFLRDIEAAASASVPAVPTR